MDMLYADDDDTKFCASVWERLAAVCIKQRKKYLVCVGWGRGRKERKATFETEVKDRNLFEVAK